MMSKKHGKDLVQDAQATRQEVDVGEVQPLSPPAENRLYTKRPVIIEAVQFDVSSPEKVTAFMQGHGFEKYHFENPDGLTIKTLEGDHLARPGDFVIRGVKGEFYTCKPEIFAATYDVGEQITDEDAAQLAAHEGATIYEDEWNACLTMAFKGQGRDMLPDWGNVPFVMAQFIMSNLDAPDEAVLMQVRLKEKVVILPNEDQRRVLLAVKLFSAYVLGWHAIDRADAEVLRIAEAEAKYLARAPQKLDLTDTPYELVDGPFDQTSDLARAAAARGTEA
jgi:hypothetical protein